MSNFPNDYLSVLRTALLKLSGEIATDGDVVFIKDLDADLPQALANHYQLDGSSQWEVYAVSDQSEANTITVDRAVELREVKGKALILLIDPIRAGAGRDGIFSAGREIRAQALFETAIELAEIPLVNDRGYLSKAERAAATLFSSGVRRRNTALPAKQRFNFRIRAASHKGHALAALGLWPLDKPGNVGNDDIEISAGMVRRLFDPNELGTPEELVGRLLLDEESDNQVTELCTFLRQWKPRGIGVAMSALPELPHLLLGSLKPGFASERPRKLHWESWQKRTNGVHSWSGLQERTDEKPSLILNREDNKKKCEAASPLAHRSG
jgi:DNA phosphorothioation-dependent restriction protein DptH